MLTLFGSGLLFIVLGVLIKHFKWYWLIAGYNTMSAEKKKKVDIKGLGRLMGNFCYMIAAGMFALALFTYIDFPLGTNITLALIGISVIFLIIRAQQYDGNSLNPDGTLKKRAKFIIGAVIFSLLIFAGFIYQSSLPNQIQVGQEQLVIGGSYGLTISKDEIAQVKLEDSIPRVLRKSNGIDAINTLKGHFLLEDLGRARLFVHRTRSPFIYITTKDNQLIIFNRPNPEETKELYSQMEEMLR